MALKLTRLLAQIIPGVPRDILFVTKNLLCLLQALILKLKDPDPNPGVVISVLATIGELAQVRLEALLSKSCTRLQSRQQKELTAAKPR